MLNHMKGTALTRWEHQASKPWKNWQWLPILGHLHLLHGCWSGIRDSYTKSWFPNRGDPTEHCEFSVRTSASFLGGFYRKLSGRVESGFSALSFLIALIFSIHTQYFLGKHHCTLVEGSKQFMNGLPSSSAYCSFAQETECSVNRQTAC